MDNEHETQADEISTPETDEKSTQTNESPDSNDTPDETGAQPVADSSGVTLETLTGLHVDGFDPTIHAVDEHGNPKRRGDGSFAKKRGRKPGQQNATQSGAPASGKLPPRPGATTSAPEFDPIAADVEQAARTATNLTIGVSVAVFGSDFVPDKHEPEIMKGAFRDYFAERGVTKLPPELALAAALAGYYIPRMSKPTVKTRAVTLGVKIRDFFARFKRKPKGDATPDDNRGD